jgi:cytosine deaminase
VLLQARDAVEAIRLRANRLKVWRKGAAVAESAATVSKIRWGERQVEVDFLPGRD